MASVAGNHNGDLYNLTLDTALQDGIVLCLTDLSITFQRDTSEVQACRGDAQSSGGWKAHILGDKSFEIAVEGYIRMANDWNPLTFFTALDTDAIANFTIEPIEAFTNAPIPGGQRIVGQCFISNLEQLYANDELAAYSLTLMGQGRPDSSVIPA
jgi:predicted secreted protein